MEDIFNDIQKKDENDALIGTIMFGISNSPILGGLGTVFCFITRPYYDVMRELEEYINAANGKRE